MAIRLGGGHQGNQPPDMVRGQLVWPESYHPPPRQRRLQAFLQVGGKSPCPVVATVDVDAALDLDERPARQVGEVGPPLPDRVKPKLLFQLGSGQHPPQQFKAAHQPAWRLAIPEHLAQAGCHRRSSLKHQFPSRPDGPATTACFLRDFPVAF